MELTFLCLLLLGPLTISATLANDFFKTLYDDAFEEVKARLKEHLDTFVIPLDEGSYRNLVLPGNPHFRSIVLFLNLKNGEHLQFLDMLSDIALELSRRPPQNLDDARVFFFYVDMSDKSTHWITNVHRIYHLPDIVRIGKNVHHHYHHGGGGGSMGHVENFNAWITKKASNKLVWTAEMFFKNVLKFSIEKPREAVVTTTTTTAMSLSALELMGLVHDIGKWLLSRKLLLFTLVLVVLLCLYMLMKHTRALLMGGSIAVYSVNVSCLISSLVMHLPYGEKESIGSPYIWHRMLNRLFTSSTKTQYFHECIIVSTLILSGSFLLVGLSKYVESKDSFRLDIAIIMSLLSVVLTLLVLILNHKGQPYSFDFIPAKDLPRGGLNVDRGFLF